MNRDKLIQEINRVCGFSMRSEGTTVWLIEKAGRERELTSAEGNLWADVYERLFKDAEQSEEEA